MNWNDQKDNRYIFTVSELNNSAKKTLEKVKEVLIELAGVWKEQTEISHKILIDSGFSLVKTHNYNEKTNPDESANEIWKRN